MSNTANPNPDWYPDPTGRFEQRYWDGSQWTEHVSSAGQQRTDALPGGPAESEATSEPQALGDAPTVAREFPLLPQEPAVPEPEPEPEPAPQPVAAQPVPAAATDPAPEWYPDPTARYEMRYWDGSRWTEHVTSAGQQGVDPLPEDDGDTDVGYGSAGSADREPEPAETPAEANPFAAAGGAAADLHGTAASPSPEPEADLGPVPGIEQPVGYVVNEEGQLASGAVGDTAEAPGVAGAAPEQAGPAPDWYPDPAGRQEMRYWDGSQWTEHASTGGQQVVDPLT